jgi:PAS domain S-box-containing protein
MTNTGIKNNYSKANSKQHVNSPEAPVNSNMVKASVEIEDCIYRNVIHNALEGFILEDNNFKIIDVNDALCNMVGYSRDELISMKIEDLLENSGETISRADYENILETQIRCKSGCIINIKGDCIPLNDYPGYFSYFIEDITEQKKMSKLLLDSQNEYHALFDNVPIMITESNFSKSKQYIDGLRTQGVINIRKYFEQHPDELEYCAKLNTINAVNEYVGTIYQDYQKYDLTDIDIWMNRLVKDEIPINYKSYRDYFLFVIDEKVSSGYEYLFTKPTGEISYIYIQKHIVPGHENTWDRVITISTDVTELKQKEIQLQQYKDHLEELVETRTAELTQTQKRLEKEITDHKEANVELQSYYIVERNLREQLQNEIAEHKKTEQKLQEEIQKRAEFVRLLVHELKTPLIPVLGTSELLTNNLKDEMLRKMAYNVNCGAQALSRRVNELLDIERADVGTLHLNNQQVDPALLLKSTYDYVYGQAKEKEQVFSLEIPDKLPEVYGDIDRLQQVLFNLLGNAFKFTPYGGHIILRGINNNSSIIVEIEDDGPGIPAAETDMLFQPYCHLHSRETHHSGLGIGLALCKKIIELHNGSIWVKAKPDKGSIFGFSIPIKSIL